MGSEMCIRDSCSILVVLYEKWAAVGRNVCGGGAAHTQEEHRLLLSRSELAYIYTYVLVVVLRLSLVDQFEVVRRVISYFVSMLESFEFFRVSRLLSEAAGVFFSLIFTHFFQYFCCFMGAIFF